MMPAPDFAWRHKIGHVANNEKIAGLASGKNCGVNTRVAAGNNQRTGLLALFELIEQLAIFTKITVLKLFETGDEFFNVAHVYFLKSESAMGISRVMDGIIKRHD
jgi:hypothetical protein